MRMDDDIHNGIAGEDLTGSEGLAVIVDVSDSNRILLATSATSIELAGILYEGGADDTKVKYVPCGYTTAIAGATGLVPNDKLTVNASSQLIKGVSTNKVLATFCPKLEEAAAAAGIATYHTPAAGDEIRVRVDSTKMTILP